MKALWVSNYPEFGGPHNAILQLREPLRERGWESVVLLPQEPGTAAERLRAGGVQPVLLPLHRLRASLDPRAQLPMFRGFRRDVAAIRALIRERRCDLVVLTGVDPQAALAARRNGAAIVWQVLASRPPRPVRAVWMTMIRRGADAVMFNGGEIERMYVRNRRMRIPTYQVKWAVDPKRFRPDPSRGAATRGRMGVPVGALFVGAVGNLVPMKGIEYFIRAAALIHRRRPDSWFLISGSTSVDHEDYVARLHEEIGASGVPEERFIWTDGPPDDVYPALNLMLITSLPRSEGTTTTALESMACETPVVATDVGSVPEIVADGLTGRIVPPGDPGALAAATVSLAADPELLARLGAAGRRRVIEGHSLESLTNVYTRAFEAAMSHRRR
jgi:glycosyltransferase involved in cell wall biosynthesis